MRPRLLDLFCGAGGCTKGYQRAGFYVVGVDSARQPNYCGDEFIQADALDVLRVLLSSFFGDDGLCPGCKGYRDGGVWCSRCRVIRSASAVHASVPCQLWTAYRRKGRGVGASYPDLIAEVRATMGAIGKPYVIENVEGAPLENPVRLCGSSFGLDVRRHRLFETNWPLLTPPCDHSWQTPRFPAATNREPNSRRTVEVGVWRIPLDVQQRAMGIDWMTREELSQSIPPAYTEHIGHQLMQHIEAENRAAA